MNMEASRWWLHLAKAGDLEVVVACADIAERERDRIGSSMGGRVSGRRGRRAIRRRPVVHRRVGRRGRRGVGAALQLVVCLGILRKLTRETGGKMFCRSPRLSPIGRVGGWRVQRNRETAQVSGWERVHAPR